MREIQDFYFHKAKKEGFVARSVFKLEELDLKLHLLAKGAKVLECGASPGSWLQYTVKKIGPKGEVVAFDLQALEWKPPANVTFYQKSLEQMLPILLDTRFDCVLSDMAPKTSGIRHKDAYDAYLLSEASFKIALAFLKKGGNFVTKTLQGSFTDSLKKAMVQEFQKVHGLKPKSSRKDSTEFFLCGLAYKGKEKIAEQQEEMRD